LYEFDGVVAKLSGEPERLEASNLILRGCTLKNTEWVLGMVLFAGVDTKVFRNRMSAPRKVSDSVKCQAIACALWHILSWVLINGSALQVTKLEGNMDTLVLAVFILLLATAAWCSVANDRFLEQNSAIAWYMRTDGWVIEACFSHHSAISINFAGALLMQVHA
jgi:magnesium-transporting ATPase (P-type)